MSVPDLPFVGQKHWGSPLNAGIKARTSSAYLADKMAEDGPFRSSLASTIDTRAPVGMTRGSLPDGTDANEAYGPEWNGTWYGVNGFEYANMPPVDLTWFVFTVEHGGNAGVSHRVAWYNATQGRTEYWVREANDAPSGSWGTWNRLLTTSDLDSFSPSASERIKALARRDGWTAVYDPTDPETTVLDGDGRVIDIHDGLGNLNRLSSDAAGVVSPELLPGEFGQLAGMVGGWLRGYFGTTHTGPSTMLVVAKDNEPTSTDTRWLIDARGSTATRRGIFVRHYDDIPRYQTSGGLNALVPVPHDTRPHLFRATFNSDINSAFTIDGVFATEQRGSNNASGITLGASVDGEAHWTGTFGLVLVHLGEISEEKVARMSNLITSLMGTPPSPAPRFAAPTVAYSEDQFGEVTFSHGDPDAFNTDATVASVTKLMTVWLARKHLTDAQLDDAVTVISDDLRPPSTVLQAGDIVSYRSLFSLSSLPSDNTAPRTIARTIGQMILDSEGGSGDAEARFVQAMNDEAADLGYEGATFTNPQFGALLTARQAVNLLRRSLADPALRAIYEKRTDQITITGPAARTENITHTVENSPFQVPGFAGGKTGSNYGYYHIATAWTHPDGSEHYTAILNAVGSNNTEGRADLYRGLRRVMAATA